MRKKDVPVTTRKTQKSRKQAAIKRIARIVKKKPAKKQQVLSPATPVMSFAMQKEGETVERAKFNTMEAVAAARVAPLETYNLPVRYGDNRIALLPRDPWWMYAYWDISENRINEVIASIPVHERESLRWALRVYDVTGVASFSGGNANSFFDIDITYEANNWYINVNTPESSWCVEIGFKNPAGKFFAVARSNIIKTPYFGISSVRS
ncbi:MAG: DUF4912 domain-containing protein, partial [Candidatus Omnitrophica bacterium]|nr:DUF4912 domain-containing protein [Candidatus Omnitrophota bacterium]